MEFVSTMVVLTGPGALNALGVADFTARAGHVV